LTSFLVEASARGEGGTQAGGPEPAVTSGQKTEAGRLLVTGLGSVIELPTTLFGSDLTQCVDFAIASLDNPIPGLRITSTGMAGARLIDPGLSGIAKNCPDSIAARGERILTSGPLGESAHTMRLLLPPSAFPTGAAGARGKLLLVRAGSSDVEFSVQLRRLDYSPFQRAFLWFFGIAMPLFISSVGAVLVFIGQKTYEATRAERQELKAFREDEAEELQSFFEGLYKTIVKLEAAADYHETMKRELAERKILRILTWNQRSRLVKALREADRRTVASILAKVFPDNAEAIRGAFGGGP
jgi:hypothetical protein